MKRAFGWIRKLFKSVLYLVVALFVINRVFGDGSAALHTTLMLTVVTFLLGFFANLNRAIIRIPALVATLVLVYLLYLPYAGVGRVPTTDNLFYLAWGLGYLATPLANLKWNVIDKRLKQTAERAETTTEQ